MPDATPPTEQPAHDGSTAASPKRNARTPDNKRKQRVELAGAIVIGIAAVLTAIATVQGGNADAAVAKGNTTGIADTLIANGYFNDANAQRLVERDWIFSFMSEAANDAPAADIILYAMPDEVFVLADDWLTANEIDFANPKSELIDDPFSSDYAAVNDLLSAQLEDEGNLWDQSASCAFFSASVAGVQGDSYGISTVFLAIAIVVGGIAALVTRKLAQIILLTTALLSLAVGAIELSSAGDMTNSRAVAAADFFVNDDGTPMIETNDVGVPLDIPAALGVADTTCPDEAQ